MKPILYIDQQITKARSKAIELSQYIDENKSLSKTRLRELLSDLQYHLREAQNTFPQKEKNHETEEEANAPREPCFCLTKCLKKEGRISDLRLCRDENNVSSHD